MLLRVWCYLRKKNCLEQKTKTKTKQKQNTTQQKQQQKQQWASQFP